MAKNLRRPSSSKDKDMVGRFNLHGRCKKHPKHHQAPGVCSLCLKDKLSQVLSSPSASSSSQRATNSDHSSSLSSSSSSSSSSVSSCASPHHHPMHPPPVSIFLFSTANKHGGGGGGLVKSKSMAVFPTTRRLRDTSEGGVDRSSTNKKTGFWFKLLHPKSKTKRMLEEKNKDTYKVVRASSLRETITLDS